MKSPCKEFLESVMTLPDPMAALDELLAARTNSELCALFFDWEGFWARPKQLPPEHKWTSWGGLTGRGWGKTRAMAELVNAEVEAGRATRIAMVAQNEDSCIDVMILGECGLIATSKPWLKASYELGRVIWPNGAQAFVFTPERPKGMYGPQHDLLWTSEIHAWPRSTMLEAFSALKVGLRLGMARHVWDSNPRRKHPIIRMLLERSELNPMKHPVFRGSTQENIENLNPEAVQSWIDEYSGTMVGMEMLEGIQCDDVDGSIFRQEWIDRNRRPAPTQTKRKVIAIDPSISSRKGTDANGIVMLSLGLDDQIYLEQDLTCKCSWEEWATLCTDLYFREKCDCVSLERNRGGDACIANLRAIGQQRGTTVVPVDAKAITRHVPNVIYVKEVIGRTSKVSRGEPVASLCEKGRISHVIGGNFADLEEQLTTYEDEPNAVSPNNYDAYVWGVWELAGFWHEQRDSRSEVASAAKALNMIAPPRAQSVGIYGGNRGGRRI